MYATYFGTDGRTLEADDAAALNCAYTRDPAVSAVVLAAPDPASAGAPHRGVELGSRMRPGGAILSFTLASEEAARLELYDVAGRRLATLVDGTSGAGRYEIAWDGATGSGRVGPGVYFARIVTPQGAEHATVILSR